MDNNNPVGRIDIKPLTSLRFFAAAGVLYGHFGYAYNTAGLGVSFFFMLSGFILTHSYYSRFNKFDIQNVKKLWMSRAARIYPIHLATLLLAMPLFIKEGGEISFSSLLENAALVHSWYPNKVQAFSYNSVSWTLSNELFFYLSLPFILIALKKTKIHSKLFLSITLIIACIALTAILMHFFKPIPYSEPYSWRWWLILVSPYINFLTFVAGMLLSFVHRRISSSDFKLTSEISTFFELSTISIFVLYFLFTFKSILFSSIFFMYGLPLAGLILVFASQKGLISRLLSTKPLIYLGEISFSMYMIHQIVIRFIDDYLGNVVGPVSDIQGAIKQIGVCILVILISSVMYHAIEKPARSAIKRLAFA